MYQRDQQRNQHHDILTFTFAGNACPLLCTRDDRPDLPNHCLHDMLLLGFSDLLDSLQG